MERWLRDLRLEEERAFLQRAARGPDDGGGLPDAEPPPSSPHRRAPAIVPEPLPGDAAAPPPPPGTNSQRYPGGEAGVAGGSRGSEPPHRRPRAPRRDLALIAEAVQRSDFLRRLGEGCPEALARSFVTVRHEAGDTVVAEGDEGNAMYIVAGEGGPREPGASPCARPRARPPPARPQPRNPGRACACARACARPPRCTRPPAPRRGTSERDPAGPAAPHFGARGRFRRVGHPVSLPAHRHRAR